jgi:hypothetical protein
MNQLPFPHADGGYGDTQIATDSHNTDQNASRVKFSVHVRLPKGGSVIDPQGRSGHTSHYDPLAYDDN